MKQLAAQASDAATKIEAFLGGVRSGTLEAERSFHAIDAAIEELGKTANSIRYDVETQRQDDQFLIQAFLDAGFEGEDLKWLNWCRLYLRAVTLSDICTADGQFITKEAWMGRRHEHRRSFYRWPRTKKPSSKRWDLW